MAKNTYKTKSKKKAKKRIELDFSFLKDRRFQLALGFFFLSTGIFLLISFISYLFTGKADQSVIEALSNAPLKESGLEAQNWLGLFGAYASYFFIYKWFGIASLLILHFCFW